jgi:fibronectin type 3 domain-containing protein
MVSLSWNSAEGRSSSGDNTKERLISSYRVYRNGSAIQDVTENTYQDTGLVNGITYSYYVTTIYTNPAGNQLLLTPWKPLQLWSQL